MGPSERDWLWQLRGATVRELEATIGQVSAASEQERRLRELIARIDQRLVAGQASVQRRQEMAAGA